MTECERLIENGTFSPDFFKPEVRCDFLVDEKRKEEDAAYGTQSSRIGANKRDLAALAAYLEAGGRIENAQDLIRLTTDLNSEDLNEYLCDVSDDFNPAAQTSLNIRGYAEKLAQKGKVISAIAPVGGVMGILAGYFNNPEQGFSYVSAFHVRIPFRRMHIGKMLMDKAVEISRAGGFKSIRLKADKSNLGGIGFYERYGFVKIGEDEKQYEMSYKLREK